MSQHGLQKPSQGAMIAKRSDFEKGCFVLVFAVFGGYRPFDKKQTNLFFVISGLHRDPKNIGKLPCSVEKR